ncbi:hypothetical protein [Paenibacillus polymyxa]|uniref:hypothetical protein n=1 Tax=Paenibacillus polymyxa TaxID=1406 RepID=UPI00201DBE8C|nr:hypothetical protein [Paenibacillus polymyxa]
MDNKIDIHLYHFGMYPLYPYASRKQEEDAEVVGKKRSESISHLPRFELKSNDEFVSEVWSDLILRRYPEVGEEIVTVPSFSQLRILFTADNFGITLVIISNLLNMLLYMIYMKLSMNVFLN